MTLAQLYNIYSVLSALPKMSNILLTLSILIYSTLVNMLLSARMTCQVLKTVFTHRGREGPRHGSTMVVAPMCCKIWIDSCTAAPPGLDYLDMKARNVSR